MMPVPSFEYVLPVIRGIQAGREFYVSMFPGRLIPKLFVRDGMEVPPEMRGRRSLNSTRVWEISRYMLENPRNYVFSAIAASIDADVTFEAIGSEAEARKIGRLRVPMDAQFSINDGQHRLRAFELALKEKPELGYETIAVIFFLDIGLERSQQIFHDLNYYGVRLDPSLKTLYDRRDVKGKVVKEVMERVRVFRMLTDRERSRLSGRSGKLFTLSSIYGATMALLANCESMELEEQIEIGAGYWNVVSRYIWDWERVLERQVSAAEIRQEFVHCQAIALLGLGEVGATLISRYPESWEAYLRGLTEIDWSYANGDWEGGIMVGGRVGRSRSTVSWMTGYIKKHLNLPATAEEERLGNAHI